MAGGEWKTQFAFFSGIITPPITYRSVPILSAHLLPPPEKISKQFRIHAMATQIVELAEVERLSSLVIRVLGGNPGKVCILSFLYRHRLIIQTQFTLQGKPSHTSLTNLIIMSNLRHKHIHCWHRP